MLGEQLWVERDMYQTITQLIFSDLWDN